jgi:release factor glutamine methyltransferase
MTTEHAAGLQDEAEAAASGPRLTEVIRRSTAYLERHGVPSARTNVETLLMHLLGTDRASLYTRSGGLDTPTAKALGRALCQRCVGVPLQHLTGEQMFYGLRLSVEPGVFVPRPESEVLVDAGLEALDRMATEGIVEPLVVDVGTGTGAIALAVASARPSARVHATDVDPRAVALARRNAEDLGLSERVTVHRGDLLDPLPGWLRGRVDVLLSNPPYLSEEEHANLPDEVLADPRHALVGGTTMHARTAEAAADWVRAGGSLIVEMGPDQEGDVRAIFGSNGLSGVEVLLDLAGRARIVRGTVPGRAAPRASRERGP